MKSLRYLPFTFLAGVHGFVFFTPYMLLVVAALHVARRYRGN